MSETLTEEQLKRIYGARHAEADERFALLKKRFEKRFEASPEGFFSSPGRTEIIGNHTDHNGGKVLAASIDLDTIGAVSVNGTSRIRIISEAPHPEVELDLEKLQEVPKCRGSLSLVAGMAEGVREKGFRIEGFDACVSSTVLPSAGVSSSASYEMLLLCIINALFNEEKMSLAERAAIGQYAENVWWEKASGMMDQMACAHGGTVLFDFKDGVKTEPVPFSFEEIGCEMILVNSGKGHADLREEYSSIPNEMRRIASALGKKNLVDASEEALMEGFARVRRETGHDRALLRALHFYRENQRVEKAVAQIRAGHPEAILPAITASGNSSWKWLQSCYVTGEAKEQPVAVALALTERFLEDLGEGVCRINGGGFGGVMMCVLPKTHTGEYMDYMTPFVGRENVHLMHIRETGAVRIA
ncbi:MAG: galactokinase [Lachnospiraceae bacterium]|nr:galactokinase [Lachnospiraceae bacterium]